jgi:[CysO sulfur-carrier protein]-S-L-cysteine hydrolase
MQTEEIQIPRKITNQLLHHAQQSPDTEVCGLIGSRQGVPISCYAIKNTAKKPQQRFLLEPKQQIAAMAKMRDRNEELFAIYHSHPTSPAIPSKTDLDMAAYPDVLYLIISLDTKGILELRGYRVDNHKFLEIPLSLIQD